MTSPRAESVQRAVAVVAAWSAQTDTTGPRELEDLITQLMLEDHEAGYDGRLVIGLTTVAGWLARDLANVTSEPLEAVLQRIATTVERYGDGA